MPRTASGCAPSRAIRCVSCCQDSKAIPASSGCAGSSSALSRGRRARRRRSTAGSCPTVRRGNSTSLWRRSRSSPRRRAGKGFEDRGFYEISGLAWSGHGKIAKVDVSFDGGGAWIPAALQEPILPKSLTRFRAPWRWTGDAAVLTSRATDETGYVQPSRDELLKQRDARSYYHYNGMQRWRVGEDGVISNAG